MTRRTIGMLIGLAASVVILWISAIWIGPLFLALIGSDKISDLGATGDLFGVVSSLFAGLGAYAVVVVLIIDLRERRKDLRHRQEEFRPFVTLEMKNGEIEDARWKGEHFHLTLALRFTLLNLAQAPALNLQVESSVKFGDEEVLATVSVSNTPLLASTSTLEPRVADVQYTTTGEKALRLFRLFENGANSVDAELCVRYTSMNEVSWISRVTYRTHLANPHDHGVIARVAASRSAETIGKSPDVLGSDNIVLLSASAADGTWGQERGD